MDEFNRIAAIVFAKLYEAFPQGIRIFVEEVNITDDKSDEKTMRRSV
jgi:hypothetical protein